MVRIGDEPNPLSNPVCGDGTGVTMDQINAGQVISVSCFRPGRYISVHLQNDGDYLTLCEVKAYHCFIPAV